MQCLTVEWVAKAEGDWNSALRELRARKAPNYDAACFHAQQCAEKYLKARLQEAGIAFGKTHNLVALLKIVLPIEPTWDDLRTALQVLTEFAVEVGYPGTMADKSMAREAVSHCNHVRQRVRERLRLKE
ncbi:MAG: DNA-binding protein [Planctomycetes bacterium RBG_16_64_10]|nr:MAG: DNA-binding protein [Planctomycetes bacterium RBG_16_64_10]